MSLRLTLSAVAGGVLPRADRRREADGAKPPHARCVRRPISPRAEGRVQHRGRGLQPEMAERAAGQSLSVKPRQHAGGGADLSQGALCRGVRTGRRHPWQAISVVAATERAVRRRRQTHSGSKVPRTDRLAALHHPPTRQATDARRECAHDQRARRQGNLARLLRRGRNPGGKGAVQLVPLYIGVDAVSLRKRFAIIDAIARAAARLPELYLKHFRDD